MSLIPVLWSVSSAPDGLSIGLAWAILWEISLAAPRLLFAFAEASLPEIRLAIFVGPLIAIYASLRRRRRGG